MGKYFPMEGELVYPSICDAADNRLEYHLKLTVYLEDSENDASPNLGIERAYILERDS